MLVLVLVLVDELAEVAVVVEASDGCFKYGFAMDEATGGLDMANANVRPQMRGKSVRAMVVLVNGRSNELRSIIRSSVAHHLSGRSAHGETCLRVFPPFAASRKPPSRSRGPPGHSFSGREVAVQILPNGIA